MPTSDEKEIDFDAHYTVAGYRGIAFYLVGYKKEWTEESYTFDCIDPKAHIYDDDHASCCYLYNEPEEIENRQFVIAVMVGDDRRHEIDVDDLTMIKETDFCRECGQIGCAAVVYE